MASTPSSSGRSPAGGANTVLPYRMHVSQRYLDLTRQKLELARLPREPQSRQPQQLPSLDLGVSKATIEPLVDHWLEEYNWRAQEAFYNESLPQYRLAIHGTRIHFVHKRSMAPNAIPILFVHGWPESFIAVSNIIDALCNPVATPPRGDENVPTFHVVVPSIPGFGFSDQVSEEGNNLATTAEAFDALMKSIGYPRYIVHGSGWGFQISRMIALTHSESCVAIHTCNVNSDVPPPRSNFGYAQHEFAMGGAQLQVPGVTPPLSPGPSTSHSTHVERPQTMSYALCDSPVGLLAYVVDAIRPPLRTSTTQSGTTSNPTNLQESWPPSSILNWTMLHWLPGPEVALRWLVNSSPIVPNIWTAFSNVPLAVSQYEDPNMPSPAAQYIEAYHRIAMLRRRPGVYRFPAWERPSEIVHDLRDLATLAAPAFFGGFVGGGVGMY